MESKTIDLDGPVHYLDFGGPTESIGTSAAKTMVLVHGLGGSHVNWMAAGPGLARHARVLAPDLAGFGRTPLAGRSSSLEQNRLLLDRFLRAVGKEPVVLIGNSMGGLLSLMQTATNPRSVSALVLTAASLPAPPGVSLDREVALVFALYMLPWVGARFMRRRAAKMTPEQQVMETLRLCCVDASRVPSSVVEAANRLAHDRRAMSWADKAFLEAARSVVTTMVRRKRIAEMIRAVHVPTMMLHGRRDRLVPLAAAESAHRLRPDWPLEILDDIGHVPQLEAPDRFVEIVQSWLGSEARLRAS